MLTKSKNPVNSHISTECGFEVVHAAAVAENFDIFTGFLSPNLFVIRMGKEFAENQSITDTDWNEKFCFKIFSTISKDAQVVVIIESNISETKKIVEVINSFYNWEIVYTEEPDFVQRIESLRKQWGIPNEPPSVPTATRVSSHWGGHFYKSYRIDAIAAISSFIAGYTSDDWCVLKACELAKEHSCSYLFGFFALTKNSYNTFKGTPFKEVYILNPLSEDGMEILQNLHALHKEYPTDYPFFNKLSYEESYELGVINRPTW